MAKCRYTLRVLYGWGDCARIAVVSSCMLGVIDVSVHACRPVGLFGTGGVGVVWPGDMLSLDDYTLMIKGGAEGSMPVGFGHTIMPDFILGAVPSDPLAGRWFPATGSCIVPT